MRSLRLSLALCALAALVAACARNSTNAPAASTSATNQTTTTTQTTTTVQTDAANQSSAQAASSSNAAGASSDAGAKKSDACALLTSADIKSVQGEEVRESKPSQSAEGALSASQCFFATATFNKSVSLQVTRAADAPSMRRYWDTLFARAKEEGGKDARERDREKRGRDEDRDKKKEEQKGEQAKGARGEEEEESAPPTPVKGVGEEAYWATSKFNGILYALKGDAFVRVSLGGADKPAERLRKSKALAQKALARL